jgi:hypothetical protein
MSALVSYCFKAVSQVAREMRALRALVFKALSLCGSNSENPFRLPIITQISPRFWYFFDLPDFSIRFFFCYLKRDYRALGTVFSRECGSSDIRKESELFPGVFQE